MPEPADIAVPDDTVGKAGKNAGEGNCNNVLVLIY
jgi:hypothetical protein